MKVSSVSRKSMPSIHLAMAGAVAVFAICSGVVYATETTLNLVGGEEVPAVQTKATGTGMINVAMSGDVTGSVKTMHLQGTAAHVHEAAMGKNGPVVFALTKDGDTYSVPAGTRLTSTQQDSYKAGNLYVNVHTVAHPDGELRAQLKP